MTTFLTMLGLVTFLSWGYVAIAALAYALTFREIGADRLFASLIWPVSLPVAVVLAVRWLLTRPKLPRARVRRRR